MHTSCCIANGAFGNVVQTIASVFFTIYYAYLKTVIPKCKSISHFGLMGMMKSFVETNKHTNIILMEVSHRYDLIQDSCVNKEVEKFNSRIRKHMKVHEDAEVMKVNLDRRGFTKYVQHMNTMRKELMAKRIVEAIKHMFKVCKKTPIA